MTMFYEQRTVLGGKSLRSVESVKHRLIEIRDNKKSTYHKAYLEGRIHVHFRTGAKYKDWTIYEVSPMEKVPGLTQECGSCGKGYISLHIDYLCPSCRSET